MSRGSKTANFWAHSRLMRYEWVARARPSKSPFVTDLWTIGSMYPMKITSHPGTKVASSRTSFNLFLKLSDNSTSSSRTRAIRCLRATMSRQTLTWLRAHPYSPGVMWRSPGDSRHPSVPSKNSTSSPARKNSASARALRSGLRARLMQYTCIP